MEIVYKNSLLQKAFFGILLICIVNTFYIGLLHAQAESTENVDIPVVIESTPDGGVWSEAETWIGGQVPTDTNDVVINGS
ncbi:hypothetical protein KC866_03300, partial [Patescibacteria group bacterium]|nr:hypothetical protein [Patescibacteria group bacterium]